MFKRSFSILLALFTAAAAQTPVAVSAIAQVAGQSITITSNTVIKDPVLTGTLVCPARIVAGTTGMCTLTVNIAPSVDTGVPLKSNDVTQFTVPSSVTLKAGTTTVQVPMTATP